MTQIMNSYNFEHKDEENSFPIPTLCVKMGVHLSTSQKLFGECESINISILSLNKSTLLTHIQRNYFFS